MTEAMEARAVNEAPLCVSCVLSSGLCVCLCGCVSHGAAPPLPRLPPLLLPSFSVLIYAHGGFQGFVVRRSDATSTLDLGLG